MVRVPKNTGWDVAAAANGDHQVGREVAQNALSRGLAQLVHLSITCLSVRIWSRAVQLNMKSYAPIVFRRRVQFKSELFKNMSCYVMWGIGCPEDKNLATYIVVSYVDLLNHFEFSLRVCDPESDTECAAAVLLIRGGKSAWSIFLLLAQKR